MNRKLGSLLAGVLLLAGLAVPASAQTVTPDYYPFNETSTDGMVDETPTNYIVEFQGVPQIEGGSLTNIQNEQNAFKAKASSEGLNLQITNSYTDVMNGLAVKANSAEIAQIRRMAGVSSVSRVNVYSLPPDVQVANDPEMYTALAQTGADIAQNELGLTGAGVKVAVMDTGIDFNHPDLGGCFGPGCRVAYGWDLVGDAYDVNSSNPTYNPVPHPDPIPDDCAGHGTHVAGIIGANGTVKGVAPGVTFGAYRVFGCNGSTDDAVMIEAMERARQDGMQVLNMSIGAAFTWPQSPTGKAASRLVKKGMVVVASIGNSGADGLYSAGAPGLGEEVIGVASMENTAVRLTTFTINPDGSSIGYQSATAAPLAPTSGSGDLAKIPNTIGCTASGGINGAVTGKIVLISRGTCTFAEKAANAQAAGATGVVLYNNAAGRINPTVAGPVTITIPVVSITKADGLQIAGLLNNGPVSMTWTNQGGSFANPGANMASSFSSYGLAPDLTLKPDIAAPGGNIYSTYPLELGGYATLSGTSMASPHTAGAVALLLQAKPNTKATDVRAILQNSAVPQLWSLNPSYGLPDSAARQGAGMLRIDTAVLATTSITPGKISLGESQAGPKTTALTVKNNGTAPVTYTFSSEDAIAPGGNTFAPGFDFDYSTVTFDKPTVTLQPGQSTKVNVTIAAPSTYSPRYIYSGWVVATPDNNGAPLRVPFAGYVGDYQAIQVLTPTANGFPWLAYTSGPSLFKVTTSHTYTMTGGDIAYLILHLNHQAAMMRAEVVDMAKNKTLGLAFQEETYLPRNTTSTGYFSWVWDGYYYNPGGKAKLAPEGNYKIVIKVLKANGDKGNPAHWETWTSPTITIDRP